MCSLLHLIVILRLIEFSRNRRDLGLLVALGWKEKEILKYQLIGSLTVGLLEAALEVAMSYAVGEGEDAGGGLHLRVMLI